MNALLIYPKCPETFWSFIHALKFISKKALHPPLGLITMAAMLPRYWEKKVVDLNVEPLSEKHLAWAEMVFISAMTVQRESATAIIEECRQRGLPVVAGGPLFTANPEDFPQVDHLVLGEAEETLSVFLADLEKGEAAPRYDRRIFPELDATEVPRWDLLRMSRYLSMSIQYSRGCPFSCEFCDITTLYGRKVRTKSAGQILTELDSLYKMGWRGSVFFVDDNFIGNKTALKKDVLPAIIDWMKKKRNPFTFSTECSINLADDEELMDLMREAGFEGVFVGIESTEEACLQECGKHQNAGRDLQACVRKIQMKGLQVRGGFILGFDHDTSRVFQRHIDFIQKSGIITAMVGLLNAPRGSRLYRRIQKEGRLLSETGGDNTSTGTNIQPLMGYQTLVNGYRKVIEGIYSPRPYHERVKAFIWQYASAHKRTWRFHIGAARLHWGYPLALIKGMVVLGVKDKARWHFWRLLAWSLIRKPSALPLALTFSIYGYHFRRVFEAWV